LKVIHL